MYILLIAGDFMCKLKETLSKFIKTHHLDGKLKRKDDYMISYLEEIVENAKSDYETESIANYTKFYIYQSILAYVVIGVLVFIMSNIFLSDSAINEPSNVYLKYTTKILIVLMFVLTTAFSFFPHKIFKRDVNVGSKAIVITNCAIILIIASFFAYFRITGQ